MAIARVSGNILQDNLQRGANLSIQGNLLYIDVVNSRVGVLTSSPQEAFNVVGTANVSNVKITSATANRIFYADSNQQARTSANLQFDGTLVTVIGNVTANGVTSTGNISATGNISSGNSIANGAYFGNVTVTGNVSSNNINVTANAVVGKIYTDNYYYANGSPVDFQQPAGSNTQIQYNLNNDFGASGNLTFDQSWNSGGGLLTVGYTKNGVVRTDTATVGTLVTAPQANIGNIVISGNTINSSGNLTVVTSSNQNVEVNLSGTATFNINTSTALTLPAGNVLQRPGTPLAGALRFNTGITQVEVYDGTQWEVVGTDFVSITNQTITGNGVATSFTLDQSTSAAAIIVSTNGVVQTPDVAYTVSGNIITFAEAPLSSDSVDVRFTAAVTYVNSITNTSGNASITVDSSGVANIATVKSLQLPSYTVAQANALTGVSAGQLIYVTNGDTGNPCLAVYSAGAWKRVSLGANIST